MKVPRKEKALSRDEDYRDYRSAIFAKDGPTRT